MPVRKTWQEFVKDEHGALGGSLLDALIGFTALWGLLLIITVLVTIAQYGAVVFSMYSIGYAYSINDLGVDPSSGAPFAQEAITQFSSIFPVASGTSPDNNIPSSNTVTQPQQLALYLGPDPLNQGYDKLAVDYMLKIPVPQVPFWKNQPSITTPMFFQLDFYQTW